MSGPEGRGAVWTEERRERGTSDRSDEGRRRLKAPRRHAGQHSMTGPQGRGATWTEQRREQGTSDRSDEGRRRHEASRRFAGYTG
ncbi:hypothetical protein Acsp03_59450 [Actinomadura sp. NBRC 104412]|nr:hypothetical protein Acsp03_59450 [Actinomadura sp. NBRC 104412]